MKFRELETVVLERDIPEHGLRKGRQALLQGID
jgi:hypothetical protein